MKNEQRIENALIQKLQNLKYTYRSDIRDRNTLEKNFHEKFNELNQVNLTNAEFARLRDEIVTADVFAASKNLRQRNTFIREDSTPLHYTLVNIKDWCKNHFEVINQLRINTDNSHHRYDVILLINGIPTVQIELKEHKIVPHRAMEQIVNYKNDPGNGYTKTLLCFIQLFIVSNQTNTHYFTNNHKKHFSFDADERFLPIYQLADEKNQKITHLDSFADNFLAKCTLGRMISRYMVLVASEQKLMMMRPYQIYAVKAIIDCITQNRGNGYIWHTTGSGKTLTSFKASTLLKDNPDIDKCLFVVDRKDLDRQTREEFNKFQEGCVEENTNTETLVQRLLSEDYADKIIVTTIQKLGLALDDSNKHNQLKKQQGKSTYKQRLQSLYDKRIIFIFDECHRSQFGDNHEAIKNFFSNAQLFGFTGTPIFPENASYTQIDGREKSFVITEDIFQKCLHEYTITNAIEDRNVLRFHIDYYGKENPSTKLQKRATLPPQAVIEQIIEKHDSATNSRRFNALLATASINDAIEYYQLFQQQQNQQQAQNPDYQPLNIACVFSPPAEGNQDTKQLQEDLPQEKHDNRQEPEKKKAALKQIVADYNTQYSSNHTISEFDLYYQDVQQRIKDQQYPNSDHPHKHKIDILIVVDMLLTGFDSKYLNTLYVDKNLKNHTLIQAFSRTNRVLNDTKPYGHILDFRNQEQQVNQAISLFSGQEKASSAKEIWLVEAAPEVIKKFDTAVTTLQNFIKRQGLEFQPQAINNLQGDEARAEFINVFKEVQNLKNQLEQYTDLTPEQKQSINELIPEEKLRGFRGAYLETAQRIKAQQQQHEIIDSPIIQDLDLELVLFSSAIIDYDYIMKLVAQTTNEPEKWAGNRTELIDMLASTSNMMDEREELTAYINGLKVGKALNESEIRQGYQRFKTEQSAQQLATLATQYQLTTTHLNAFVDNIINRMIFDGEQLTDLFVPLNLGWKQRAQQEEAFMNQLIPLLKKRTQGREISGLNVYEQPKK